MVMNLIGFLYELLLFLLSTQFYFPAQINSILAIFALNPLLKQPQAISKRVLPSRLYHLPNLLFPLKIKPQ